MLRINLKGMFLVGQAAAKQMVAQVKAGKPPGAIVNMSSINARVAIPNQVPYCVSKGGVDQLTKVMALALAPLRHPRQCDRPGSIMTDILKGVANDKAAQNRLLSRTPLGRIADPDEIASVAAFLASKEASYITGETIYVDGGRLALNYTVPVPTRSSSHSRETYGAEQVISVHSDMAQCAGRGLRVRRRPSSCQDDRVAQPEVRAAQIEGRASPRAPRA